MKKHAEYFIGGPMDGEEKTKKYPRVPDWGIVEAVQFGLDEYKVPGSPEITNTIETRWHYRREHFTFGGIPVYFWTDTRYMSREMVNGRLAEVLMAPHDISHRPEVCVCTDSVHSCTGWCPAPNEGEYDSCPRRRMTETEIIKAAQEGAAQ